MEVVALPLTGTGLVVALVLTATGLFVLVVSGWPRRFGRVTRAGMRAASVLALNGVVVLLVLAVLNDQYIFYTSWADLLGARQTQAVSHHGGTATGLARERVAGPGLGHLGGTTDYTLPNPGQRIQHYSVTDPATGNALPVLVVLPAGYDPRSARAYPVVLGLHGYPGVPKSWLAQNFLSTADSLTAAHRLGPMVLVIPQIDDPRTTDTECTNGPPGDPQTETWLASVVPQFVVRHLHVRTTRTAWATFGYSYGGWCAASLTMRHPDVFGAAVVIEGYFAPDFLSGYDPFRPDQLRSLDLIALARRRPPPVAMWVFASRQDSLSWPTTARFLTSARAPLAVTAVVTPTGGHRPGVFGPYVKDAWLWLASTMAAFRA